MNASAVETSDDPLGDGTSLADIEDTFAFLDDWEERYRYVIDLGKKLPPLDEALKTEATKVRGCQSQVWLVPSMKGGRLLLKGDSDAHIVRGLVAIMLLIFSGKTPAQAVATDARAILEGLGLAKHLSPLRANGLFAMVERIGEMARQSEQR